MNIPICTRIVTADELPDLSERKWLACSSVLAPRTILAAAADPRWRLAYAVAERGSEAIGIIGLYRKIGDEFPAEILDPAVMAPDVFPKRLGADDYLLIGGSVDMVSGSAVSPALSAETTNLVRRALVDAGFRWAEDNGLVGAAMYVRDSELSAYAGPTAAQRPRQQIGEAATLMIPPGGWEGYVGSLGSKKRIVLKDVHAFSSLGLRSQDTDPRELIEEAAPLILAVRARHNLPDHKLLIQYRLSEWIASCAGSPVAFTVRDAAGRLLGVSFGCCYNDIMDITEVGMVDDPDVRHVVYTEILIYSPIRFAAQGGYKILELGLGSIYPKKTRGATVSTVWAVGGSAVDRASMT